MAGELATRRPIGQDVEQVLLGGDLAKLTPDQRLNYYNTLCNSLGLNPLTQPFQYIVLNQKLQLYAKKDCTEQLRKIHGVSITSVDPKQIGDLLVVVASASDREGRVDSGSGAVNPSRLKRENLANSIMKAETKAKRRVTLSLCGLGMLDETEVDTLRQQGAATEPDGNKWEAPQNSSAAPEPSAISHQTDEPDITPRSKRNTPPPTQAPPDAPEPSQAQGEVLGAEPSISEKQGKRLFAIAKSAGLSDNEVKARLASIGWKGHRDEIPKRLYEQAVDAIDPEMKFHTNTKKGE